MPTYRYRCAKCGDELEEWQSFSDAPLTKHRACGGKLARVLSTPGIVLRGSGFYRTDSRNGSSAGSKRSQRSDDGASPDGSDSSRTAKDEASKPRSKESASSSSTPSREAGTTS